MKTITLPSGSVMPSNGFGTWKAEPGECAQALRTALDVGYRHIDCAAVYQNERELGEVFAEYCSGPNPKIPREQLFVTSKVWNTCHARNHVMDAIKQTLADLQLDYLDLYLVHHPFAWKFKGRDSSSLYNIEWAPSGVTLEDTWRGMEDVLDAKLTRNIGISNYSALAIMDLCRYARIMPAIHQFEVHVLNQRSELRELGDKLGIHNTMYSILGSGKEGPIHDPTVNNIASKHGVSAGAVCIAWGLSQGCSVLSKSINKGRIISNFEAEKVQLDDADMQKLASLDEELRTCNMVEYWGFPSHC